MFRKLALAAVIAVGGLVGSASIPAPAQAQFYIGVGGPGYGGHRRHHSYDDGYYDRRYERRHDRRRYYGAYGRGYERERYCTVERRRVWNGYRYARERVRVCR